MSVVAAEVKVASVDWGRLFLVPLFVLLLLANVSALAAESEQERGAALAVGVATSLMTVGFNAMVVWAYLRRGRASATHHSWMARSVAVLATAIPMLLVLDGSPRTLTVSGGLSAGALMAVGMCWSLWALSALGSNLSVVAQVRGLTTAGPYQWVRHPLYVGEIVTVLGIAMRSSSWLALSLWLLLVVLQSCRALAEESLLRAARPGYEEYCSRTARLLPGVF